MAFLPKIKLARDFAFDIPGSTKPTPDDSPRARDRLAVGKGPPPVRHVVERLERDFHTAGRIPLPNLTDWTQTGNPRAQSKEKRDSWHKKRAMAQSSSLRGLRSEWRGS